MTIFLMLSLNNNSLASVFLIYLLPLILFTTPSCSILLHHLPGFGISSLSLQWFTSYHSSRTSAIAIPSHILPHPLLPTKFPKASFLAQFFSIFIPLLLALSSVHLLALISYRLTIHNSSNSLFPKFLVCHKQPLVHYYTHLILDGF